jgi:hypothetical protein
MKTPTHKQVRDAQRAHENAAQPPASFRRAADTRNSKTSLGKCTTCGGEILHDGSGHQPGCNA